MIHKPKKEKEEANRKKIVAKNASSIVAYLCYFYSVSDAKHAFSSCGYSATLVLVLLQLFLKLNKVISRIRP
jgi:hypothetical protein